jgi:hypothetical protein
MRHTEKSVALFSLHGERMFSSRLKMFTKNTHCLNFVQVNAYLHGRSEWQWKSFQCQEGRSSWQVLASAWLSAQETSHELVLVETLLMLAQPLVPPCLPVLNRAHLHKGLHHLWHVITLTFPHINIICCIPLVMYNI